jgi:RNA polymerase sigma factor (sigma-70 family)
LKPAPDPPSEHELIERCLGGDDAAWSELVARYQGLVYSVPRRMRLSEADAADVFQTVFMLLFQRLSSIRDPSRLGGWLLTTATREAMRAARRGARAPRLEDDAASPDEALADARPLADEDREAIERAQMLRSALAELSERCRTLLEAFLEEDEPNYRDVARRLEIPIGSIGPTRARCLARLRELLERRGLKS